MRSITDNLSAQLVIPKRGDFHPNAVRAWFLNVAKEIDLGVHIDNEQAYFEAYFKEAGLLRAWRQPFFFRHYADTLAETLAFMFAGKKAPVILDVGCGTGTQSLLFALHGASVVAVDMDAAALRIFRRRVALYQELTGQALPITILEGNAFNLGYGDYGPFDGVYSLFAFNMMQPSAKLVDLLLPHLAIGARWAILDGNNRSFWTMVLPTRRRNVWSPSDMARELAARNFKIVSQKGGVALPPLVWTALPFGLARSIDQAMCTSMFWPISCQTLAILGK